MAVFSWFAGQRPLSSLARQASVKVALQSMSAFVRVMIKAPSPASLMVLFGSGHLCSSTRSSYRSFIG